ncbi:MAG: periplasmic heavy metal sensor [Haloferula sp.]
MTGFWRVIGVVVLAGATAWFVGQFKGGGKTSSHDEHKHVSEDGFHQWMHERLALTPEQHAALEPVERSYEETRRKLVDRIESAGRDLGEAVRRGDPEAPAIEEALNRLNEAQAELQRATLDHFFSMKKHLTPAQAERLLSWTHDSIVHE